MNPKLVKFVVELQNSQYQEKEKKIIYFNTISCERFFNILKTAKVFIHIDKI